MVDTRTVCSTHGGHKDCAAPGIGSSCCLVCWSPPHLQPCQYDSADDWMLWTETALCSNRNRRNTLKHTAQLGVITNLTVVGDYNITRGMLNALCGASLSKVVMGKDHESQKQISGKIMYYQFHKLNLINTHTHTHTHCTCQWTPRSLQNSLPCVQGRGNDTTRAVACTPLYVSLWCNSEHEGTGNDQLWTLSQPKLIKKG